MLINDLILKSSKDYEDYLIKTRNYLHKNPELSGKETNTSNFLKREISKLDLKIHEVDGTGFYAVLDSGRKGKVLGLRSDIDALPIQENERNLSKKRLIYSNNKGIMHACGHDGHMAILLATAKFLVKNKDKINGKVIFIFEEGEEQGTGIESMLKSLEKIDIDAFYGNHLTSFMDTGQISMDQGPVMAGCAVLSINIIGKGGHGSRPDLSINPIFAASNILNGLTTAWSNQLDVTKTVTLGVGSINGGSNLAPNVIPDKVKITGTLRFFDMNEGKKSMEVVENICNLTAKAHNCRVEFDKLHRIAAYPVNNDNELAKNGQQAIKEILPNSIVKDKKWFASESFSRYSELAPSLFSFIGTRNKDLGSGAEHHNEYFDIDDKSLIYGFIATSKFAVNYLKGENDGWKKFKKEEII